MPFWSLGIWTALAVLVHFILAIFVYPSALVLWTRFWKMRKWYRFYTASPELADPSSSANQTSLRQKLLTAPDGELRPIEKMFRGPGTHFTWLLRWPLILICLSLIGVSVWLSLRLATPVELEYFLPESHELKRAYNILRDDFPDVGKTGHVTASVMLGVKGVKVRNRYDFEDFGEPVIDETFDIKNASAQQRLLEACSFFANLTDYPELGKCWPKKYLNWRKKTNRTEFETFPSDADLLKDLRAFSKSSRVFTDQNIILSETKTKVVFSELKFVTRSNGLDLSNNMLLEREKWIEKVKDFNGNTEVEGVKNMHVTGDFRWVWAETQVKVLHNLKLSALLVLVVWLFSLTVFTGNIFAAFLAVLCIFGVLSNVLGLIVLLEWKLGPSESISVILSAAFCFVYIALITHAYVESPRDLTNTDRTRAALTENGTSVLAGTISILVTGSPLFFATGLYFKRLGLILTATVAFTILWSLAFFPAFLHVFGPTNNTGELWVALQKLFHGKKGVEYVRKRFPTIDGWTMNEVD